MINPHDRQILIDSYDDQNESENPHLRGSRLAILQNAVEIGNITAQEVIEEINNNDIEIRRRQIESRGIIESYLYNLYGRELDELNNDSQQVTINAIITGARLNENDQQINARLIKDSLKHALPTFNNLWLTIKNKLPWIRFNIE